MPATLAERRPALIRHCAQRGALSSSHGPRGGVAAGAGERRRRQGCAGTCWRSRRRCASMPASSARTPETWGLAGLLHDYDWEIHPTLEPHPDEGAPLLRERGCPETVVQAILSHNSRGDRRRARAPDRLRAARLRRGDRPHHRRRPRPPEQGRARGGGQVDPEAVEGEVLRRRRRPRRTSRTPPPTSAAPASRAGSTSGSTSATCSRRCRGWRRSWIWTAGWLGRDDRHPPPGELRRQPQVVELRRQPELRSRAPPCGSGAKLEVEEGLTRRPSLRRPASPAARRARAIALKRRL